LFTKYATVEQILEVKTAPQRLTHQYGEEPGLKFAKFAAMDDMKTEDGYLYVRCRAISSRVNKNNDGWPAEELMKAAHTFIGKPIFVDHNNDDPRRTRGVIIDSVVHTEDPEKVSAFDEYYASAPENHTPPTWIELLLEIDGETYPKLADAIRKGDIDAVSMGANIEKSVCSVCANEAATPAEYCNHIKQKGIEFEIESNTGERVRKKAYEDCYGVSFFEISNVFDPADETADILHHSDEKIEQLAKAAGVQFEEMATYLASKGEYAPRELTRSPGRLAVAAATGEKVSVEDWKKNVKVAMEHLADNPLRQFMSPLNQSEPASPNRNYVPQHDMVTAPQEVNTLRDENTCPTCRSANMEADTDGIMSCPVCGHVQEPDPLDNPDLGMARDVDLRQNVTEDVTPEGDASAPASDPLDSIEFSTSPQVAARKAGITDEGISEMFTTKLRTTSKEEADKLLPVKVARLETKLGAGVTRAHYKAAQEAGISVKLSYPAAIDEDSTLTVPGNDGIFNLFYAEESASQLKVPMSEVPIVIEGEPEAVEKFQEILTTVAPRKSAAKEKTPILDQEAKVSDEPKDEKVVQDAKEPVESKVAITLEDGRVELDGKKYTLVPDEDEPEEPKSEAKDEDEQESAEESPAKEDEKEDKQEEPKADEAPFEDPKSEEKPAEDREAKLLAAFKLADLSVEMGIVDVNDKMAFIAELEEQSMEAIAAREATLNSVKTAGLAKRTAKVPGGIKRVPRLAHSATPLGVSGSNNGSVGNGLEDSDIFL
jgi:hypothetical protein